MATYSCLEKSHGQRSLVGYSPCNCKELDTTESLALVVLSEANDHQPVTCFQISLSSHPVSIFVLKVLENWISSYVNTHPSLENIISLVF